MGGVVALVIGLIIPLGQVPATAQALELPDLVSVPPTRVQQPETVTWAGETNLVIRFDGHVTNVGSGPLDLYGNPSAGTVAQRARSGNDWVEVGNPQVLYETADGHNHFHLMKVAKYSLWNEAKTAEVAPGQKVGFCLYDVVSVPGAPVSDPSFYGGSVVRWCEVGNPNSTELRMGISAGYQDIYDKSLTFQWVDVSNVSPGVYWVAAQIDPNNVVVESNEANNTLAFSEATVTVPGYVAAPLGPVAVPGTPVDIALTASVFGSPSSRRFRIVDAPEHGTLDVAVGPTFSSPTIRYTPDPGYVGGDSFTYAASDQFSQYPRNPVAASVTIDVGVNPDVSVAISGAPAAMIAGTSVQLSAAVVNAGPAVDWLVNGVVGGTGPTGTITTGGLYVAPAAPPPGGSVTIRARSRDFPSSFDEVSIAIDSAQRPPNVVTPADRSDTVGDSVNFRIVAEDPDGDVLTFSATGLPPGLSINAATGTVSGTPTTPGSFATLVTASDGTLSGSASFSWSIGAAPPGVAPIADVTVDEGSSASVSFDVTDPQGLAYTCSLIGPGFVVKGAGDAVVITPGYEDAGSAPVTVVVTNDAGLSTQRTFTVTVVDVNRAPIVVALDDTTTPTGTKVRIDVEAVDPDGDSLVFGAVGLPAGLTIDPGTGTIAGTVAFGDEGTHTVTLTVSDGNHSVGTRLQWMVTDEAPVADIAYRATGRAGRVIVELNGRGSVDPEGGALRYYWDLDGDGVFNDARRWWARVALPPGESTIALRVVDPSGNVNEVALNLAFP